MTTSLNKLPHLLECRAEGGCKEEPVAAEILLDGDNTFPNGPDSPASSTPCTENFWEHGAEGDSLRTAWQQP